MPRMKRILSCTLGLAFGFLAIFLAAPVHADEVTLVGPGGIQAAVQQLIPGFEKATGHTVKPTFGSGLGTKKQVADGVPFDVPIVQPPYPEVLASGHVVANSATPLATVAVGVAVRSGARKPDISTPDAVKRLLLSVKSFSYPDPSGGAAAGVSFTKTLQQLGIADAVKSKIHLARGGAAAMEAVAKGEVEIGLTFYSEILTEPGVEAVGTLPATICPPTSLVAFVSSHAKNGDAARALVRYLSSPAAAATYLKVGMQPPDIVGVGNFSHIVTSLDKSLEFYRDVLGLEVAVNNPFSVNPAIMKLGNTPGAQSRFAALRIPGSEVGIELIEYKDIDRKPQHPRFVDPGAANMALRVRDIDSVFAKLQKFGATILTKGGKPATINNGAYLFVQDPDGFVVELSKGNPPADSKVPATSNVFGGAFEATVADSEASVKFYNELLGFPMQLGASFNDNQLMAETAGAPGASFRQSRANIPGANAPMTLIEFKNVARTPLKARVQDPGTAILQLRVRDVAALTARLKAAGVPIITAGGTPVDVGNVKISLVRSPDNLLLEFLQAGGQ
jgi:molybdate transport system substrate-binding protein